MKLNLDQTQRLNLHALMGAQRAALDDLRMLWKLQDRIELSAEEKKMIGYKVQTVNGMQQVQWDMAKILPAAEYEFSDAEFARIARMLKEWQQGFASADRLWLEPLMAQLDGVADSKPDGQAGLAPPRLLQNALPRN